jgi:hypothetical protein
MASHYVTTRERILLFISLIKKKIWAVLKIFALGIKYRKIEILPLLI